MMRSVVSAPKKRVPPAHSASSSSAAMTKNNICRCGAKVVLIKSKTVTNPGRMFWRCPFWRCSYFKWADEEGFSEGELGAEREDEFREEQKLKILKLKTKSDAERRKGKLMMAFAFGSWLMTFIVCIVCVGKCPCSVV
ncbi:Zinc finger, GRF-type [Sesbania bispinosa]|nr:Zinc finger, GRF-type [Sesbania bispinosa]